MYIYIYNILYKIPWAIFVIIVRQKPILGFAVGHTGSFSWYRRLYVNLVLSPNYRQIVAVSELSYVYETKFKSDQTYFQNRMDQ